MSSKRILLSLLLFGLSLNMLADEWKLNTRKSFYTQERQAEALLVAPDDALGQVYQLTFSLNGRLLMQKDSLLSESITRLPFSLAQQTLGKNELLLWLKGENLDREIRADLWLLEEKPHAVKLDRLTGGLIINNRPEFPYGFYCYSPVQPTIAEDEVVRGFNMMSPYQQITEGGIEARQAYMDRCAELGMKVHYNLLSVSGGGGVGSGRAFNQSAAQKKQRLIDEINRFKDHPALLAWYISDEPTGHGMHPDSLQKDYDLIKSIDPYHPITIVFMAPMQARKYADAMDIVMADPYPIPNQPPRFVGTVTKNLMEEFKGEKPIWMVPQAFGGAEWWGREPSLRELRVMTWLSLVEGATGIQYFVRHGPNGFPKSTASWGECGKIGLEIGAIKPFLTSGLNLKGFQAEQEGVRVNAWEQGGDVLIVAVNEDPEPSKLNILSPFNLAGSRIEVLFEGRIIEPEDDYLNDFIDGYDRRVYRLSGFREEYAFHPGNLILDPGFEDISNPGVPASCYARAADDRGASYFLDAIDPLEGRYSLKMVTPKTDAGMGLTFFPVRLSSGNGYTLSIWAKMDTLTLKEHKRSFFDKLFGRNKEEAPFFTLGIGSYATQKLILSADWKQYKVRFHVPTDGTNTIRVNPFLTLNAAVTAWFDVIQVHPDPEIVFGLNEAKGGFEVFASSSDQNVTLRYATNGSLPTSASPELVIPIQLTRSTEFTVGSFSSDTLLNYSSRPFSIHKGIGHKPIYTHQYTSKYNAGGAFGLVDGIQGSRDYLDGRWQGFMARDLIVDIDLKQEQTIRRIALGCLQDTRSWIFMPRAVSFWGSLDGKNYVPLGSVDNTVSQKATGAIKKTFELNLAPSGYRFIRVKADNIRLCPDWHNGKGQAAFLFADEIIIE